MTAETESPVLAVLRRVQVDLAKSLSGQHIRHRLSLIGTRLPGIDRNMADQNARYADQTVRIDRLGDRLGRIEGRLELTD